MRGCNTFRSGFQFVLLFLALPSAYIVPTMVDHTLLPSSFAIQSHSDNSKEKVMKKKLLNLANKTKIYRFSKYRQIFLIDIADSNTGQFCISCNAFLK